MNSMVRFFFCYSTVHKAIRKFQFHLISVNAAGARTNSRTQIVATICWSNAQLQHATIVTAANTIGLEKAGETHHTGRTFSFNSSLEKQIQSIRLCKTMLNVGTACYMGFDREKDDTFVLPIHVVLHWAERISFVQCGIVVLLCECVFTFFFVTLDHLVLLFPSHFRRLHLVCVRTIL